jgi:VanZ family protein
MRKLLQATAWFLLLVIVGLSVVSPEYRVSTPFPQWVEHFTIFLAAGVAFGLGYHFHYVQSVALLLFTGAIELTQLFIPGRDARFVDFAVNSLGLVLGIAMACVVTRWKKGRKKETRCSPARNLGGDY